MHETLTWFPRQKQTKNPYPPIETSSKLKGTCGVLGKQLSILVQAHGQEAMCAKPQADGYPRRDQILHLQN